MKKIALTSACSALYSWVRVTRRHLHRGSSFAWVPAVLMWMLDVIIGIGGIATGDVITAAVALSHAIE